MTVFIPLTERSTLDFVVAVNLSDSPLGSVTRRRSVCWPETVDTLVGERVAVGTADVETLEHRSVGNCSPSSVGTVVDLMVMPFVSAVSMVVGCVSV